MGQNMKEHIQLPDLTFFIDVRPEEAFKRIEVNHRYMNRMDLETMEFHKKIYDGYHEVASLFPNRIKIINGERPVAEIVDDLIKEIYECEKKLQDLKEFDEKGKK